MHARRIAIAIAMALASGCSPGAHVRARLGAGGGREPARGARAEFDPAAFDAVFRKALHAVLAQGFTVVSCDPGLGVIRTGRVEMDAPCGRSTCLARDAAAVKLGYRRARVTVIREVWDSTLRAWLVQDDPASVVAVNRIERELVRAAAVEPGPTPDVTCAAHVCGPGGCVASIEPWDWPGSPPEEWED